MARLSDVLPPSVKIEDILGQPIMIYRWYEETRVFKGETTNGIVIVFRFLDHIEEPDRYLFTTSHVLWSCLERIDSAAVNQPDVYPLECCVVKTKNYYQLVDAYEVVEK